MAIERLSREEQELVLRCMKAIADGSYIEDWEFLTRLGITRESLKRIIALWPQIQDEHHGGESGSDGFLAINNCMNEVCHGVGISEEEWQKRFSQTRSEVEQLYHKWRRLGGTIGGIR
jgi:hypothetical protein